MELRVDVLIGSQLVWRCMELRVDVKRGRDWYGGEAGCVDGEGVIWS